MELGVTRQPDNQIGSHVDCTTNRMAPSTIARRTEQFLLRSPVGSEVRRLCARATFTAFVPTYQNDGRPIERPVRFGWEPLGPHVKIKEFEATVIRLSSLTLLWQMREHDCR
jgi:hypothetical protein